MKFENLKIKNYPEHEEYKLIDIYPVDKIKFRRGNSYEYLFSEDYLLWQDYFCNQYKPPVGKKIALFHCCSWSKPYDFSYIVNPIKSVADKYKDVHRIILSSVGVVPYEYQMNESFCTYDFPPVIDTSNMTNKEMIAERNKYTKVQYDRVYRYLKAHKNHYKAIVTHATPINYGMCVLLGVICKELNIMHVNVIDKELYNKLRNKKYGDLTEILIENDVLYKLDSILASLSEG